MDLSAGSIKINWKGLESARGLYRVGATSEGDKEDFKKHHLLSGKGKEGTEGGR